MTWELWAAFKAEWRLRPPVHWLVASFVGYEPPEPTQYMTADAAKDWLARTGGRIDGLSQMNGAPT